MNIAFALSTFALLSAGASAIEPLADAAVGKNAAPVAGEAVLFAASDDEDDDKDGVLLDADRVNRNRCYWECTEGKCREHRRIGKNKCGTDCIRRCDRDSNYSDWSSSFLNDDDMFASEDVDGSLQTRASKSDLPDGKNAAPVVEEAVLSDDEDDSGDDKDAVLLDADRINLLVDKNAAPVAEEDALFGDEDDDFLDGVLLDADRKGRHNQCVKNCMRKRKCDSVKKGTCKRQCKTKCGRDSKGNNKNCKKNCTQKRCRNARGNKCKENCKKRCKGDMFSSEDVNGSLQTPALRRNLRQVQIERQ